jgi:hypothetical protein
LPQEKGVLTHALFPYGKDVLQILLKVNIILWNPIVIFFVSPHDTMESLLLGYFSEEKLESDGLIVKLNY